MGGGHHHNPAANPRADQDHEAMAKARVPLAFRDTCAHLLMPLNKCRRETWWSPNQCGHERHTYEECLYNSYLQRCEAKVQEKGVLAARAAAEAAEA
jgi:NADH dehydrogenase (ubiquinone) 1 beta subcomplex subunit 7